MTDLHEQSNLQDLSHEVNVCDLPFILAYKPSLKLNKKIAKLRSRLICA